MPVFIAANSYAKNVMLANDQNSSHSDVVYFTCKIPGKFMNSGKYTFQLRFGIDNNKEGFVHQEVYELFVFANKQKEQLIIGPPSLCPELEWSVKF
jgi:hypothetical protein